MKNRIKRIYRNLDTEVDAIVLASASISCLDPAFFYVTGLEKGIFSGSLAIFTSDSIETLIPVLEEPCARTVDLPFSVYRTEEERKSTLGEKLGSLKKIGVNFDGLTHRDYLTLKECSPDAEFLDVSKAIAKTRMVKEKRELDFLRQSCSIAARVAEEIPDMVYIGMKEYEAAAELSYKMQTYGASGVSFESIVAFGENSALPHYTTTDAVLREGDLALFDFGAVYRKYCSDITRTFVAGRPSPMQREIQETVLVAQKMALDMIQAGVNGKDVDQAVKDYVDGTKFKGKRLHSIGHSIGLSVHDGLGLSWEKDNILEENMVITVEPGIYIQGYGGVRIEDDVLVKKRGYEILTSVSKELRVITRR